MYRESHLHLQTTKQHSFEDFPTWPKCPFSPDLRGLHCPQALRAGWSGAVPARMKLTGKSSDPRPRACFVSGGINASFVPPSVAGPQLNPERLACSGHPGPWRADSLKPSQVFTQSLRSCTEVLSTGQAVSETSPSPSGTPTLFQCMAINWGFGMWFH